MFKKNKNNRRGSKGYISQKSYTNPYFEKSNNNRRSSRKGFTWKAKFALAFFVLLAGLLVWFFIYSKYFLIYDLNISVDKQINIGGIGEEDVEKITREHLRSKFILLPANNIFLFDENELYQRFNNEFAFEEVVISKNYPNKLDIYLREVSYALVWHEDAKYYYITTEGEVIKEIMNDEEIKGIFPVVYNQGRELIYNGTIPERDKHLEFIVKLNKELNDENIFNIDRFIIGNENDNTVTMDILDGPEVYFDVHGDYDNQKQKLLVLKDQKLRDDLYSKTYIDLRFGDMIYYR